MRNGLRGAEFIKEMEGRSITPSVDLEINFVGSITLRGRRLAMRTMLFPKDPCGRCLGTGTVRCLTCGGAGIQLNSSLLSEECLKCQGARQIVCLECLGSGEWNGGVFGARARHEPEIQYRVAA
jgi:DnaJ-class molecular chaperone